MSLADVWAMNTWAVMMMVTQNVSDSSCCTVVRFSHEDTRTRTQRRSFVTVQHEDYLLFIKWKWLIEGLHPPLLTKAEEEEGLVLLSWEWGAETQEVGDVDFEADREAHLVELYGNPS